MATPPPVLLLDRAPRRPDGAPRPSADRAPVEHEDRLLVCAACGRRITSPSARTARSGRHAHTFANPHGFVFHIGCFTTAPGCRAASGPSTDFAWFPGFAWQVAVCRGCGEHLGWLFRSAEEAFCGLILDRLVERSSSPLRGGG
jgi:hypothetical protein